MYTLVEIIYNPYIPRLNILFNGEPISQYSKLIQFTDEDIWYWKDDILYVIYAEIRQEFLVQFTGVLSDSILLQARCEQYEFCKGFKWIEPKINTSLQNRLGLLNQIIKKQDIKYFKKTNIESVILFDKETECFKEEISEIEIKNSFCSIDIETVVDTIKYFEEDKYYFYITRNYQSGVKYLSNIKSKLPKYLIIVNGGNKLKTVCESQYIFEASKETVGDIVFECFLTIPLVRGLRNCINSLESELQNEIGKVYMLEPLIHIDVGEQVEEGRSGKISIQYDPPIKNLPKIIFKILDESIANTNNMYVFGKHFGVTVLEAYIYGERIPFFTKKIEVIRRNRIKTLLLDESQICIGEGDRYAMGLEYTPIDADNTDLIMWKSTDEDIASVSSNGVIVGHKEGNCKVICTAENVSAICTCVIKPYLKEIRVNLPFSDIGTLRMEPFEEIPIKIELFPSNSIDSTISIKSSDSDVVNIVNQKFIAKKPGTAQIVITNNTNTKSIVFIVSVSKRKIDLLDKIFKK